MFGWEFPPKISGGLGTACYNMAKALINRGVDICFVVPNKYEGIDENVCQIIGANQTDIPLYTIKDKTLFTKEEQNILQKGNIKYIRVKSNLIPYIGQEDYYNICNKYFSKNKYLSKDKTTIEQEGDITYRRFDFSLGYTDQLPIEVDKYAIVGQQIAKTEDFDIIHCHDWLTYKAGIMAKQISGKKLVIHVHATEFDRSGENINQDVYKIEKMGMDYADRIITVSNYTKNIVIKKYGQDPNKITTVYNGITHKETNYKHQNNVWNKKIVTFLGRVTFQKGPDYFIEAAAKVLEKDKNIIFVIAGSGDMLNRMVALVAQKRISENFYFTGFLSSPEVEKMFELSDVYVMPSVSEPFGISPLEAMREGVSTIISKQSGVSEIVSYAIKVDFWDIDMLANSIYGLTHYNALRDMVVNNAAKEILKITWDKAAEEIHSLYSQTING